MKTIKFRISHVGSLLVGFLLLSTAAASLHAVSQMPSSSDVEEVESIVRDYIEGWYTGDVERMDRSLHADLVKRMPVSEGSPGAIRLHSVPRARMLELTAEGGGENPDAVIEIFVDDVSTDIAAARVASPEYLDYLHLSKTEGGWKIVNVLFHARD